jgi:hypothetical protein
VAASLDVAALEPGCRGDRPRTAHGGALVVATVGGRTSPPVGRGRWGDSGRRGGW